MLSIFDLAALLLTLSALFGRRLVPMPHATGFLVLVAVPAQHLYEDRTQALPQVDLTEVVMNGMPTFLLFAGAMNLDLGVLRDRARTSDGAAG